MVRFYKNGDGMAIHTDCDDAETFLRQVGEALARMINGGSYAGDWEFQLGLWLPQVVDICCALSGHRPVSAEAVEEHRWIRAGRHGSPLVAEVDNHGKVTLKGDALPRDAVE